MGGWVGAHAAVENGDQGHESGMSCLIVDKGGFLQGKNRTYGGSYACKLFTHKNVPAYPRHVRARGQAKMHFVGPSFSLSLLILTWETWGVGRTKAWAAQARRAKIAAVFMANRWERSCACAKRVWSEER